jgi:TrmH family RNA methyltransferase
MALIEMPQLKFDASMLAGSITLMLDGINDPGNLGSIIRSADWFGIDQIVCSLNTVDVFHPKVVQATMGSVFRMNVYETDLVRALSAHSADIEVYGAFMDGASIYQTRLNTAAIYIIGSESHGISQAVAGYVDHRVSIPRFAADTGTSETESLNAAVAAAIILAEIHRPEH